MSERDIFAVVMDNFERRWREFEIHAARSRGQHRRYALVAIRAHAARALAETNAAFDAITPSPRIHTLSSEALARLQGFDIREDAPK